jgi:hypothetical protein
MLLGSLYRADEDKVHWKEFFETERAFRSVNRGVSQQRQYAFDAELMSHLVVARDSHGPVSVLVVSFVTYRAMRVPEIRVRGQ